MSKIQILVTTMNNENFSLYEKMHIETDMVIANQGDKCNYLEKDAVKIITTNTKGVGKNRNIALTFSDGEIINFADDDMIFYENYSQVVEEEFEKHKKADGIIFNIDFTNKERACKDFTKSKKAKFHDVTKGGICGLFIKREVLIKNRIVFSELFGGGALYGSGEDTIFLKDLFDKKLKIYTSLQKIGVTDSETSSWFSGYDEKYFLDRGALYFTLYPKLCKFLVYFHILRHKELYKEFGIKKAIITMIKGIDKVKNR